MRSTSSPRRPIVIAGASGGATDKLRALQDLAQISYIDVIVGDWMSEANMTVRGIEWAEIKARKAAGRDETGVANAGQYLSNAQDAFDPYFLTQLEPALPHLAANATKLACNAGGSNPAGLAKAVRKVVEGLGLRLNVAWIEGDDVTDTVFGLQKQGESFPSLLDGKPLSEWDCEPICAQCYLGGTGIAYAFEHGADIVICGRIADASACVGACGMVGIETNTWMSLLGH
ncbi:hypothetical protein HBI18_200400 [Parastagonospora nodorum]|nr:hypothetical protein HBH46_194680 [Parastagonospora nodorum]KAH4111634.1 hypothetical protein HBH47_239490 [Parastagonospora nodorum]KAH5168145.1 hypothetical protein HBH77_239790 [Parastagonospora nodorum]KAH5210106.1 hypothetical protein HBH68_075780 [Parastagonospora nodorum]KAH5713879.1 hypothetical protein HBI18_200400 [Parastagonospora nodorum]